MRIRPIVVIFTLLFSGLIVLSKDAAVLEHRSFEPLQAAMEQLNRGVEIKIKKENYIDAMEETRVSKGTLYFSNGRLRLELKKPEEFLMVLKDGVIWMENNLPKEFGSGRQVVKMKVSGSLKKRHGLLALVFDNKTLWEQMTLNKKTNKKTPKGRETHFFLEPKSPEKFSGITRLNVVMAGTSKKRVKKIEYWDALDNRTSYEFLKIKKRRKMNSRLFEYKPPEGKFTEL